MLLLQPFFHSIRNRFFRAHLLLRTLAILAFGAVLFVALYLGSLKVISYFHSQNELGIILSLKIFQMAWMIMFSLLLFSSMVSAVSSLYLSSDNEILYSAPIHENQLFGMRFLTSFLYTSWMMVIFSLPIFGAYGTIFHADFWYYPLMLVSVLSTALTANAVGLAATILLVRLFPAKQTKDIAVYLSMLFGILLYLVIRLMRPEDMADPERFPDFIEYLSSMQTPALSLLPPAWANQLLNVYLQDRLIDWTAVGLLLLTPVVFYWGGEWLMTRFFAGGFSKAQESFGGYHSFNQSTYHPSPLLRIFHKEAKLFLRDSSEWSQLFLVGALVVVYLYNFKALPLDRTFLSADKVANIIAFANIGAAGFVATSLAARFVYPSIGAEGMAFAMIRSSPLPLQRYLVCKYLFYCIPFTLVVLFLVITSNYLLQINGPMWWVSITMSLIITWGALAQALGFGAMYADFKIESRAAVQGSFGAILFLFSALAAQLLILVLGFMGNFRLMKGWLLWEKIDSQGVLLSCLTIIGLGILTLLFSLWSVRKGMRTLEG
jgi:ABC-2 type transport system permease protein